jgi:hypothetical protein
MIHLILSIPHRKFTRHILSQKLETRHLARHPTRMHMLQHLSTSTSTGTGTCTLSQMHRHHILQYPLRHLLCRLRKLHYPPGELVRKTWVRFEEVLT